jgi:hypothetical protein
MVIDLRENIYASRNFGDTIDFDLEPSTYNLSEGKDVPTPMFFKIFQLFKCYRIYTQHQQL